MGSIDSVAANKWKNIIMEVHKIMAQTQVINTQDIEITLDPLETVQDNLEIEVKGFDETFSSEEPGNDGCCTVSDPTVADGVATVTVTGVSAGYAKLIIKSKDNPSITKEVQVTVGQKITAIEADLDQIDITIP